MKNSQSGNVLFYILIAVSLLAALSYAVSQSGRGSIAAVSDEKARLLATEIIEYANAISNATAQLRLRGCTKAQISFENHVTGNANASAPPDKTCHIFELAGGGVTYKPPNPDTLSNISSNGYGFSIADQVSQVGTDCGTTACNEIIFYVHQLKLPVCLALNTLLSIANPGDAPPESAADTDLNGAAGDVYSGSSIGDSITDSTATIFAGKTAGCMYNGPSDTYAFYRVLIAN